jgi:Ca2+-binding RTX toxin-like protein
MDTDPATSDWTNLTANQGEDTDPAWSPDGTKIAYQGTTITATDRNIYVMDANSANQGPVNTDVAHDISPDWQPVPEPSHCDITGTSGDDTRTGTTADETICGLGGNDVINGGGGNDILMGGPGNDTLIDPSGRATLNGGDGNDTASFAGSVTSIGASLLTGFAQRVGTNPLEVSALVSIENLTGSSLGDALTGSNTGNKITGGAGADELLGLGGKDRINSRDGARNDTVHGGSGTDKCATDKKEVSIKSC